MGFVGHSNGAFSIKTTYNLSTGLVHDKGAGLWKIVWGLKVPNKMRTFLWLILHRKIMCNAERFRKASLYLLLQ